MKTRFFCEDFSSPTQPQLPSVWSTRWSKAFGFILPCVASWSVEELKGSPGSKGSVFVSSVRSCSRALQKMRAVPKAKLVTVSTEVPENRPFPPWLNPAGETINRKKPLLCEPDKLSVHPEKPVEGYSHASPWSHHPCSKRWDTEAEDPPEARGPDTWCVHLPTRVEGNAQHPRLFSDLHAGVQHACPWCKHVHKS